MPATKQRKPRPPEPYARHPWCDWFAVVQRRGSITLRQGVDFRGEPRIFLQQVGTRARVDGLRVRTRRVDGGVEITSKEFK